MPDDEKPWFKRREEQQKLGAAILLALLAAAAAAWSAVYASVIPRILIVVFTAGSIGTAVWLVLHVRRSRHAVRWGITAFVIASLVLILLIFCPVINSRISEATPTASPAATATPPPIVIVGPEVALQRAKISKKPHYLLGVNIVYRNISYEPYTVTSWSTSLMAHAMDEHSDLYLEFFAALKAKLDANLKRASFPLSAARSNPLTGGKFGITLGSNKGNIYAIGGDVLRDFQNGNLAFYYAYTVQAEPLNGGKPFTVGSDCGYIIRSFGGPITAHAGPSSVC